MRIMYYYTKAQAQIYFLTLYRALSSQLPESKSEKFPSLPERPLIGRTGSGQTSFTLVLNMAYS